VGVRAAAADAGLRAIDFAAAVARVGAFLGYHVTVCDAGPCSPRTPASRGRRGGRRLAAPLPAAEADAGRIDRRTVHLRAHPRPEVRRTPARGGAAAARGRLRRGDGLAAYPRGPARRLREAGVTDDEIARLSSPIGLDLGARTPEETAVSIAAEIIAGRGAAPATGSAA
jgi:xanthine dehydrogenase accessory factor